MKCWLPSQAKYEDDFDINVISRRDTEISPGRLDVTANLSLQRSLEGCFIKYIGLRSGGRGFGGHVYGECKG